MISDWQMCCTDRDISVFPQHCEAECWNDCTKATCRLCSRCLSNSLRDQLCTAFVEHQNKGHFKRLMPTVENKIPRDKSPSEVSTMDEILSEWFRGKCLANPVFC